ncbi:MAG: diguanylate cyclase [Peptococcaceae bacterium]|nr:diguanylate cyclase [Peptococcaceae bacterium]
MNINRKVFAVLIVFCAAMLSVNLVFVLPRFRNFILGIIDICQWPQGAGPVVARLQAEYMTISMIVVFLSIILLILSAYCARLLLRPVNSFIEKINRQFSAAGEGSLEAVSARIESLCSSVGILDVVPIGVMLVDRFGTIKYFNQEAGEITGLDPSAVIGKQMLQFFPNNYYKYTEEVINTGREYLGLRNIIKVGAFFKELLFSISPIYSDGSISGAVAVFQDVTPQRKMIEVQAAYTLARDLASQKDLSSTVQVIAKAAAELVEIEFSAVFLADQDGRLTIRSSYGIPVKVVDSYNASPYTLDSPEITDLYRNKVPLIHGDTRNKQSIKPHLIMPGIHSFYSFPVLYENRIIGFLNLYSKEKNKLSRDMIYLIQAMSSQVNTAITNFYEFQKMRTMASLDGLTGLFNKKYFIETIDHLISEAKNTGSTLSLVILDIDYFKKVNDTYGHQAGDILLKEVARLISQWVRENDYVCRYGGEEFSVIMPATAKTTALEVADSIRKRVEGTLFSCVEMEPLSITVSAGVACFPEDATNTDDLVLFSDTALYTAKRSGRNMVIDFSPEQHINS